MISILEAARAHQADTPIELRQRKVPRLDADYALIFDMRGYSHRGVAWQFGSQTVLTDRLSDMFNVIASWSRIQSVEGVSFPLNRAPCAEVASIACAVSPNKATWLLVHCGACSLGTLTTFPGTQLVRWTKLNPGCRHCSRNELMPIRKG